MHVSIFWENSVCKFQSFEEPVELNNFLLNSFVMSTDLMRDGTGGPANEAYLSNSFASLKQ